MQPYHNVVLTHSSIAPTTESTESTEFAGSTNSTQSQSAAASSSAYLLPSFTYIPAIPAADDDTVETFIKAFILPDQLHGAHESALTRAQKNVLLREPELRRQFPEARPVDEILVLICGHGGRDQRCGILGPVLRDEFQEKLERQNITVLTDPPVVHAQKTDTLAARVALISHIGGHKFAGNIIIYIPPSFHSNPLAGKGIWYGRVEPQHVEGIVAKTILDGTVIKHHFRGGISQGGELLRL